MFCTSYPGGETRVLLCATDRPDVEQNYCCTLHFRFRAFWRNSTALKKLFATSILFKNSIPLTLDLFAFRSKVILKLVYGHRYWPIQTCVICCVKCSNVGRFSKCKKEQVRKLYIAVRLNVPKAIAATPTYILFRCRKLCNRKLINQWP